MSSSNVPMTAAALFLFLALLVASAQFSFWMVISGVSLVIAVACGALAYSQRRRSGQ